jgi:hypothetical protein
LLALAYRRGRRDAVREMVEEAESLMAEEQAA